MHTRALSVGVIGAGRVGAVLAAALRAVGYQVTAAAGESAASRTRIETMLPGVHRDKPTAVARSCDLLLLAVPDDALANVVRSLVGARAIRAGQYVVHTSGLHGLDVLVPATEVGARGVAMHPAMTFTGTDIDLPRLRDCAFGVTCTDEERAVAEALVADLGATLVWLDDADRAAYHAGLAHGANHLVTLVRQAADLLRDGGVADPGAVLGPLLRAGLENALAFGDVALTGPVVRGDVETVADHVATISAGRPETLDSYRALAHATAERAVAAGRLDRRRAAVMNDVLDAAEPAVRP